ncbi:MAG: hypothetical protein KKB50_21865 [Planctomycetes bacterium]|nr:hypothetical protein [Planctomycetota bacterium]
MSSNTDPGGDDVARLKTLLQSQQRQIEVLEEQIAAVNAQDQDAARVEAMKQQIREVLSEQEFRESLMPSMMQAGYDKGFFIRSSDDKFMLKITGRLQLRWTHYATRSDNRWNAPRLQRNDRTGFDVERIFVNFTGHAYDPNLTYGIYLFSTRSGDFWPFYAYANYRFSDEFQFKGGLMRILSLRIQHQSDGVGQFPDRPMVDAVFGLGLGVGAQFWGKLFDKRLEYYVQVLNALNGQGNVTIGQDVAASQVGTQMDSNPALVFRTVWHALGKGDGSDFSQQADLEFHESPGLDIGLHYAFNEDEGDQITTAIPYSLSRRNGRGGYGLTNTNGCQVHQLGLDAHFKYQGFSLQSEYVFRTLDPRRAWRRPFTNLWRMTGEDHTAVMHGAYLQAGYFLPIPGMEKKLEAVARVGGISTTAGGSQGSWEYSGGLNYYFEGNKVKLQTDVTKIYEVPIQNQYSSLATLNDDALVWRVQLQVAF